MDDLEDLRERQGDSLRGLAHVQDALVEGGRGVRLRLWREGGGAGAVAARGTRRRRHRRRKHAAHAAARRRLASRRGGGSNRSSTAGLTERGEFVELLRRLQEAHRVGEGVELHRGLYEAHPVGLLEQVQSLLHPVDPAGGPLERLGLHPADLVDLAHLRDEVSQQRGAALLDRRGRPALRLRRLVRQRRHAVCFANVRLGSISVDGV
mmetsp:Transcript_23064/g.75350  ORF Transcript_23064/g.75350 Transcript_23064/m.75350 type:complete len:208 (-) Transcript_23064:4-627(-)